MNYRNITLCGLLIYTNIALINSLSCDEITQFPEERKITLQELGTTPTKELVACLAHLSKEKMAPEEADYIWKAIVKFYDGAINVPESVMMLLHWVTPALQPEDYANITLSSIDVIANFGFSYNLSQAQLAAIAERVREDFAGKEPEDYTYYDLTALRQILCAFNRTEIERIRPAAYREAATILGKLESCPDDVIQGFAALAVQPSAFGNPSRWSDEVVESIGVVANQVVALKKEADG